VRDQNGRSVSEREAVQLPDETAGRMHAFGWTTADDAMSDKAQVVAIPQRNNESINAFWRVVVMDAVSPEAESLRSSEGQGSQPGAWGGPTRK